LIIGAMRAGTTSLHRDLQAHPDLFLPELKEPEALCDPDVLAPTKRRAYEHLFRRAAPAQLCGEASTAYTKRPDHEGVAARARALLGPDLRLIYMVREPLARARSQHHHEIGDRTTTLPIGRAIREQPRFVDYSRYAMQLEPWLDAFPAEQIKIVRFEAYVADRAAEVAAVCRFLGVDPARQPADALTRVYNKTAGRPSTTPWSRRFINGQVWYEEHLKPYLPYGLRRRAAALLLPAAPPAAERFDQATEAYLAAALGDDVGRFEALYRRRWSADYHAAFAYNLDPANRQPDLAS
jgi:hypothetical protein